jgi:hypothetical protein
MGLIPPEIEIPLCIEQGSIYHYEIELTNRDGSTYKGERFFIVLNVNPKTDEVIVLTTITSQIVKQEQFIKVVGEDPDTLVRISPADFSRLTKDSVVNCNNTYETNLNELIEKIKEGGKIFYEKLPQNLISALTAGVLKSTQVPPAHKKLII